MPKRNNTLKPLNIFEADTKRRFLILLESGVLSFKQKDVFCKIIEIATSQCGLSYGVIATRLGITPVTIEMWAKGHEAPDQYFIRFTVVQGIRELLIAVLGGTDIHRPSLAIVKNRLEPDPSDKGGGMVVP